MTVNLTTSEELTADQRLELIDTIADKLTELGRRPMVVQFVRIAGATASASL